MNKYFLIPVAACVAAVSLSPISIHAQDWTQTFKTENEKKVSLDYKFTVTFNDVPTKDLIKEIVAVKDGKRFTTNVSEYVKGQKYVHVTVDGLQYDTTYELQVHLENGLKYKLDFTTAAASTSSPSATRTELDQALKAYAGTISYFSLNTSKLYENTSELIVQYDKALKENKDTSSLETSMKSQLPNVKAATENAKAVQTKLKEAAAIVEKGPFQKDALKTTWESFLWDFEETTMTWAEPSHITTTDVTAIIEKLNELASTDPQTMPVLADSLRTELVNYKSATSYASLENSLIYKNAADLIKEFDAIASAKGNTTSLKDDLTNAIENVKKATENVTALDRKLTQAAAIIANDKSSQKQAMQSKFDAFTAQLKKDVATWEQPSHITTTQVDALMTELQEMAEADYATAQATINELKQALENYVAASSDLSLSSSSAYVNATQLIMQYEDALYTQQDIASLKNGLIDALANIQAMTEKIKAIQTKLVQAKEIIANNPLHIEATEEAMNEFTSQFGTEVMYWANASQITTTTIDSFIATLQQITAVDLEAAQAFITKFNTELRRYLVTTEYVSLENSLLYNDALDVLTQYEDALLFKGDLVAAEQAMNATLTLLQQATPKATEVNNKILAAAKIVADGPFNIEELEVIFEELITELEFESMNWETAADISTATADAFIETLTTTANTNPQKDELLELLEEVTALIEDFEFSTDYPVHWNLTRNNYYTSGKALVTEATALYDSTNKDDKTAIENSVIKMQQFIEASSDYVSTLQQLGSLYEQAQEATIVLAGWQQLFPSLSTDVTTITTTTTSINQNLVQKSYTTLATDFITYEATLLKYVEELESYIEALLLPELQKYEADYTNFTETKSDEWLESDKFLEFEAALSEAQAYDLLDPIPTVQAFAALKAARKAL